MGTLTVARVRALTEQGRYGDGGTLFLNIAPGGSKSWIQRITIDGLRRDIGFAGWPVVSLAEARELAFENRGAARRGGDPLPDKRRAIRDDDVLLTIAGRAPGKARAGLSLS